MRTLTRTPRPQRRPAVARDVALPITLRHDTARVVTPVARRTVSVASTTSGVSASFDPDPYFDYGRFLTAEGGVLIVWKDLDLRLRHTLWRLCTWSAFTGIEGWLLLGHAPVRAGWLDITLLVIVAVANWLIVGKPVALYRHVEIRPDCMIIEGADIFWLRHMDGGWPTFRPDAEDVHTLCGIYGTRFIEYLTVRRFDELDRMPETFAVHLKDAMQQLWAPAPV